MWQCGFKEIKFETWTITGRDLNILRQALIEINCCFCINCRLIGGKSGAMSVR